MSEENMDVVRRAWAAVSSHGELPFELWDEDLRINNMPEFPLKGAYEGHEGLARWRDDISEVVEEMCFDVKEVIELDDGRVLSIQRTTGRAIHTGIEIDVLWASVLTFRDGKILYAQGYWTPEQGREAVGLSQ
jgi:ketosteroid isomerase-like protein